MKKGIIRKCWMLAVFISSTMAAAAQDPLIVDGKKWVCLSHNAAMEEENHVFEFGGDIVFNGVMYKQLLRDGEYKAALREEGCKVYIYLDSCNEEHLLYDFSLKVGQTFGFGHEEADLVVAKVDYVTVGGKKRRRMHFAYKRDHGQATDGYYDSGWVECWIEGIGSKFGPVNPKGYSATGTKDIFLYCSYNDAEIFNINDFYSFGEMKTVSIDGLNYYLEETLDNTAIVGYNNCWDGELAIPETFTYNGQDNTVSKIHWLAFDGCETLRKVTIPKTIKSIFTWTPDEDRENPFCRCTSLESIEVAEDNPSFCSVDGVFFTKDMKFLCSYPAGRQGECYNVPEGVEIIVGNAFSDNTSLKKVTIPQSVVDIYSGAFENCTNLEEVMLPDGLTRLNAALFWGCTSLKSLNIPSKVKYIWEHAFIDCLSLKVLDIPESVSFLGSGLFMNCKLEKLVIRGKIDGYLNGNVFSGMGTSTIIYVPDSEVERYKKYYAGTVLPLGDYDTSSIRQISTEDNQEHLSDLQGRRLTEKPSQPGIYIQDGKKVVIK